MGSAKAPGSAKRTVVYNRELHDILTRQAEPRAAAAPGSKSGAQPEAAASHQSGEAVDDEQLIGEPFVREAGEWNESFEGDVESALDALMALPADAAASCQASRPAVSQVQSGAGKAKKLLKPSCGGSVSPQTPVRKEKSPYLCSPSKGRHKEQGSLASKVKAAEAATPILRAELTPGQQPRPNPTTPRHVPGTGPRLSRPASALKRSHDLAARAYEREKQALASKLGGLEVPPETSRHPNRLEMMCRKGAERLRARRKAEEEEAARREEAELAECTFHPRINPTSQAMHSPRMMQYSSFLDRQAAWSRRKEAWLQEQVAAKPPEDFSECTFHPQISPRPSYLPPKAEGPSRRRAKSQGPQHRQKGSVGPGWDSPATAQPQQPRLRKARKRRSRKQTPEPQAQVARKAAPEIPPEMHSALVHGGSLILEWEESQRAGVAPEPEAQILMEHLGMEKTDAASWEKWLNLQATAAAEASYSDGDTDLTREYSELDDTELYDDPEDSAISLGLDCSSSALDVSLQSMVENIDSSYSMAVKDPYDDLSASLNLLTTFEKAASRDLGTAKLFQPKLDEGPVKGGVVDWSSRVGPKVAGAAGPAGRQPGRKKKSRPASGSISQVSWR